VNNDPASPYFVPDLAGFPVDADYVEISLYYQTTSREYVEFLRDETRGTGNLTLPDPDPGTPGNQAYVIQTDPFFAQLASWGDTIWDLWTHNMNLDGATPFLMTQAAFATFEADIGTIDGPAPND
jgi:hypothetical protein